MVKRLVLVAALVALALGGFFAHREITRERDPNKIPLTVDTRKKLLNSYIANRKLGWGNKTFKGAFAPRGFVHGTAWCTTYKVEGTWIFTFAVDDGSGRTIVFVDLQTNGTVDAVYRGVVREDCHPGHPLDAVAEDPTTEHRTTYTKLIAQLEKPLLVQAAEGQYAIPVQMTPRN